MTIIYIFTNIETFCKRSNLYPLRKYKTVKLYLSLFLLFICTFTMLSNCLPLYLWLICLLIFLLLKIEKRKYYVRYNPFITSFYLFHISLLSLSPRLSLTFYFASSPPYSACLHETLDERKCLVSPADWNLVAEDQIWLQDG